MIDFTNCRVIPGRAYNGANGSKIAVEYNGEAYMLKFPPSAEGKPTDLSYTNSCISEHIASSIFNMLGIQAQETMLGTFTVKGKEKLVCACKDFTAGGKRLFDFCSIKNTVLDSDSNGSGTELSDVMDTMTSSSMSPQRFCVSTSGICSLRTLCLETLTGTTAIGASSMMMPKGKRKLHPSLTAEAACSLRPMTR